MKKPKTYALSKIIWAEMYVLGNAKFGLGAEIPSFP